MLFGGRERAGLLGNFMYAAHSTVPAVISGRRNAGAESLSLSLSLSLTQLKLCEQGGTLSFPTPLTLFLIVVNHTVSVDGRHH